MVRLFRYAEKRALVVPYGEFFYCFISVRSGGFGFSVDPRGGANSRRLHSFGGEKTKFSPKKKSAHLRILAYHGYLAAFPSHVGR